jgi:hypothetical protein
MSYSTKMQLRMLLPCLAPVLFGGLASWVLSTIDNLPGSLGGRPVESQIPDDIFLAGFAITMVMMVYQCVRLWRWSRGEGDLCYVCAAVCLARKSRAGGTPTGPAWVAGRIILLARFRSPC